MLDDISKMEDIGQVQLRSVISERPDLPIICLNDDSDGYECKYCEIDHVYVEQFVLTKDIREQLGLPFRRGFSDDYCNDEDEAVDIIANGLFDRWYGHAETVGGMGEKPRETDYDKHVTEFCGFECGEYSIYLMAWDMAEQLVDTLPWRKHIVIRCYW